ncbi:surfeit locus 1 family protein [Sphingomonas sp. BE138]|nr:SURF1 family cytochrome oxidase biogenesis protein [Sphingomonas sp. BE138]MDR6788325.1 surfeit locus 1 family protein [Sphingomonas sp. BE138]
MRGRWAFAALALLGAVLLAGLGVWQVERRAWKLALIDRVERRLAAPPVAPPPPSRWATIGADDAYTRLVVAGRWRPVPPVFAQAVTDAGAGFWVLSPLDTARGTILVNRGFVPRRDPALMAEGPARVTGLLRVTEPGGGFLRNNDPAADRWYSRDIDAIAAARRLGPVAPFFVDADAVPGNTGPRGGLTVVTFRNNHLVYAVTWFTLSAMMGFFAWRIARAGGERRERDRGTGTS